MNVTRTGGTINHVTFYAESNGIAGLQIGSDTTLGNGTQGGSDWLFSANTTGLAAGTQTYYAVATDNGGVSSAAASVPLTITGPPAPTIGSFAVTPNPIVAGNNATLTAGNVSPPGGDSIAYVSFYRETNSTPGLQIGSTCTSAAACRTAPTGRSTDSTTGFAAGWYTYYAVATDDQGTDSSPSTASVTVTAPSLPLFNIEVLASASPNGPYSSTLTVSPGGSYYFEVVGHWPRLGRATPKARPRGRSPRESMASTAPTACRSTWRTTAATPSSSDFNRPFLPRRRRRPRRPPTGTEHPATILARCRRPAGVCPICSRACADPRRRRLHRATSADVLEIGTSRSPHPHLPVGRLAVDSRVRREPRISQDQRRQLCSDQWHHRKRRSPILGFTPLTLLCAQFAGLVGAGSAATWDAMSHSLTVTGAPRSSPIRAATSR